MTDEELKNINDALDEIKTNTNAASVWALAAAIFSMLSFFSGCFK